MSCNGLEYKLWFYYLKISTKNKILLLEEYNDEKYIYDNFEIIQKDRSILTVRYDKNEEMNKVYQSIDYMKLNKINFLSYNDDIFPKKLKYISNPPIGLFYKGDIRLLNTRIVSIVGSRSCTNYGIEVTKLLTNELNSYNITIISGGAKGIDTIAHTNTLNNHGKTIAVFGCGVDICYPKENYRIFQEIEKEGLIISEFSPMTKPLRYNFPIRNRIISGLSELVIVVEASEKSGSLITASYAADQNIDVMSIPGAITKKESKGCNKLIKEGSLIFTGMEDLYDALNLKVKEKNINLSPIVRKVLSIIGENPMHIDEIINKSFIDREALYKVLFEMQIRNEIISLPGNYYAKII